MHLPNGFTLRLSGRPAETLAAAPAPRQVAAVAARTRFLKPRLAVKVGDRVKTGTLLFSDKRRPELRFLSPGAGRVCAVNYGPRRSLQEVVIDLEEPEEAEAFPRLDEAGLAAIEPEALRRRVVEGGLWSLIRELPFREAAALDRRPPEVVVFLDHLEPFHPRPRVYLEGRIDRFRFGLRVLEKLSGRPPVVTACAGGTEGVEELKPFVSLVLEGRYPAHDPGVLLYRSRRRPEERQAWVLDGQDVLLLAELLQEGCYPTRRIIALGGPGAVSPEHLEVRLGAPLAGLIDGRAAGGERLRLVAGGVLTGARAEPGSFLALHEKALTLLPEGDRPGGLLEWMLPGRRKPSYSRAFLSSWKPAASYPMDCNRHGGVRACIQCAFCTRVCPVDILPQLTYKAVLAGETEEALAHGLLDCVECGLCSLVCPSKIELLETFQQAKAALREEMR
ncbi:MAG: 4Fe-4S dicluster domain-containing protein [Desulfobacterales bacterium]